MRLPTREEQAQATGNCYEVAGTLAVMEPTREYVLVHGLVRHPHIEGLWHGHAWVEYLEEVVQGHEMWMVSEQANGNSVEMPAALYYYFGEIRETVRYTREEAAAMMLEHEHFGPWHE